jgi:hypothetical protein
LSAARTVAGTEGVAGADQDGRQKILHDVPKGNTDNQPGNACAAQHRHGQTGQPGHLQDQIETE